MSQHLVDGLLHAFHAAVVGDLNGVEEATNVRKVPRRLDVELVFPLEGYAEEGWRRT
jgi:hypothetical protein